MDCSVGPLYLALRSKDVFVRVGADVHNAATFFTDGNGMEMQERRVNARPWAPVYTDPAYPAAANFYPMTAIASFGDDRTHVSVLSENSHAAGATESGAVDIMVHRVWYKAGTPEPPNVPVTARLAVLVTSATVAVEDVRRPVSWAMLTPLVLAAQPAPPHAVRGADAALPITRSLLLHALPPQVRPVFLLFCLPDFCSSLLCMSLFPFTHWSGARFEPAAPARKPFERP